MSKNDGGPAYPDEAAAIEQGMAMDAEEGYAAAAEAEALAEDEAFNQKG